MSFGGLCTRYGVKETTPPLYFVLAWVWARVFGTGEVGLRLLSALCGIATVPVVFACARELVARKVALVAAATGCDQPVSHLVLAGGPGVRAVSAAVQRGAGVLAARGAATGARRGDRVGGVRGPRRPDPLLRRLPPRPQALWLLARHRRRAVMLACAALLAVQAAMLPLALGDTHHPLGWISAFPLATRLQQIPVPVRARPALPGLARGPGAGRRGAGGRRAHGADRARR